LTKLQGRYHTYYGKFIDIFSYEVQNCDEMEVLLKDKLSEYTIDPRCELLKKSYLKHYQSVFRYHCKTDYVSTKQKPNTNSLRIRKVPYKIIVHQNILKIFDINSLDDLLNKTFDKDYLFSLSGDIENLFKIALEGRLVRNQRRTTDKPYNMRDCSDVLKCIISLFNFTLKREKKRSKRIDGKCTDITPYHFYKN
jgi:RNA binding exosome subunit